MMGSTGRQEGRDSPFGSAWAEDLQDLPRQVRPSGFPLFSRGLSPWAPSPAQKDACKQGTRCRGSLPTPLLEPHVPATLTPALTPPPRSSLCPQVELPLSLGTRRTTVFELGRVERRHPAWHVVSGRQAFPFPLGYRCARLYGWQRVPLLWSSSAGGAAAGVVMRQRVCSGRGQPTPSNL